jgi:purine nucleosidase
VDRIPVLLDTDPGNDIDDALAISYLLQKPECEFLGITTVTGPVDQRAAIAEVLCNAVGRTDVPILAGRSDTLFYGQGQPWCAQYEPISSLPHRLDRKQDEAVDFLRQTIRNRPGEITLLSIGPFQNIALLFAIDPEIPFLLKDFVSMAGAFTRNNNHEWNCLVDPVATGIVAKAPKPRQTWYGLDVTLQCQMTKDECEARFKGPLLELVLRMATKWFDHAPKITFHDPLAAACLFQPDLCAYEDGRVEIGQEAGHTHFHVGEGHDRVAQTVQSEAFFDEFFSVFA